MGRTMVKALLRQISVLNCMLLAMIIAVCIFAVIPMFRGGVKVPAPSPAVSEKKANETAVQPAIPPMQEYIVVSENNLFHPNRILPPKKNEEAIQRPEFVLYGTLITDILSIAYISDNRAPRSTPGRGERQTGLKLGETMSGYTLKEVLPDRIIMVRGDDRMEIKVIAPGIKKRGGRGTAHPALKPGPSAHRPAQAIPASPAVSKGGAIPPAPTNPLRPNGPASRMPRSVNRP